MGGDGDTGAAVRLIGDLAFCCGTAAAAVALVLAVHSFVLFRGQSASFLYLLPNSALERFRETALAAALLLGYSVLDLVYRQTHEADVALVDWELPEPVRGLFHFVFTLSLVLCLRSAAR